MVLGPVNGYKMSLFTLQGKKGRMKTSHISQRRVVTLVLAVATFCLTSLCAAAEGGDGNSPVQEEFGLETAGVANAATKSFTPKVAELGWTQDQDAIRPVLQAATMLRLKLLNDPHRPTYHFCSPEGHAQDPNGAFYVDGRYHFMYLNGPFGLGPSWAHVSSHDLVHWRHHPQAIIPGPASQPDGAYSGGAFVDDDGVVYLSYWLHANDRTARGVGIVKNVDATFDQWKKFPQNPLIKETEYGMFDGKDEKGNRLIFGTDDPTNIWKKDGKYYMAIGNKFVLRKYGVGPDKRTPRPGAKKEHLGDHLYLFESTNLVNWTCKGDFYERKHDNSWTGPWDDNACPVFLPLPSSPDGGKPSGKHALIFFSHTSGDHYYVGTYDKKNDKFIPESHGRMCWAKANKNNVSAPEAMIDGKGRFLLWFWLTPQREKPFESGWGTCLYGLPQTVWLGPENTLRRRPVDELKVLRSHPRQWTNIVVADGKTHKLEGVKGDTCELEINIPANPTAKRFGVKVFTSPNEEETTVIYYDAEKKKLCCDARKSGPADRNKRALLLEEAPFELAKDEPLKLCVFVDKGVVEVFANDRQAISQRIFPMRSDSRDVVLFSEGGHTNVADVKAWRMQPSNPF